MRVVRFGVAAVALVACANSPGATSLDGGADAGSDASRSVDGPTSPDAPITVPMDTGMPDAGGGIPLFAVPTCGATSEAPLPGVQRNEHTCVAVGAAVSVTTGDWPALAGARLPLVFVQSDAPAGGTGTMASPFNTIAAGVDALQGVMGGPPGLGNGTVVLHRGDHGVASTIGITHDLAVLGVGGPMGSLVRPPTGFAVFEVAGPGNSLTVTSVNFNKDTPHTGPIIHVTDGTLVVRDVDIELSEIGIEAVAGHLDAQGLTINAGTGPAISLGASGDALIRSLLVRGSSVGVRSAGAAVDLSLALVAGPSKAGVSVNAGAVATTARIDRVAVIEAGTVGIRLAGSMLVATASRMMVAGTRRDVAIPGSGEGVLITGSGTRFSLDPDITTNAMEGLGSRIGANEGSGVVIADFAAASLYGAYVASNGQSGIVIQDHAVVDRVSYSYLGDNHGAGLLVSTFASLAGLVCDGFVGNLRGTMHFMGAQQMEMADGADIDPGPTGASILVSGCSFSQHEGFGLFCNGVNLTLVNATFMGNMYGWGAYNGAQAMVTGSPGGDPMPPMNARTGTSGAVDTAPPP